MNIRFNPYRLLTNPFGFPHELERVSYAADFPRVNVAATENELRVSAEVPGVNPEDLKLTLHGGILEISGNRLAPQEEEVTVISDERGNGPFTRKIRIPFEVDVAAVAAKFHAGIVTVTLPKAESEKPRAIPVLAN